jgi:uncharacterized protein (DUF2147 family)
MNDPGTWAVRLSAVTLAVAAFAVSQSARAADPVFGDWLTANGAAKVRLAPCAANPALTCGSVTWLKEPKDPAGGSKRDAKNPDATLRGRPLLGALLLIDLKREAPGHWTNGKIYAPETGRTVRGNVSANPDGTLKVEGCMAVMCQARTWTKAN